MPFYKKTLVLKEILEGFSIGGKRVGGIARLECDDGVTVFHLSLINLCPKTDGCYYAYLLNSPKETVAFSIGQNPTTFNKIIEDNRDFSKGLAVGIVYLSNGIPTVIAFGVEQNLSISIADFKKIVLEKCIAEKKTKKEIESISGAPEQKPPIPLPFPKKLPVSPDKNPYDDEVVATENFYLLDDNFSKKLQLIKNLENDYDRTKNSNQTIPCEETQNKMRKGTFGNENERDFINGKQDKTPYYKKIESELLDLFSRYPEEQYLSKALPNGKWIKVALSNGKHYTVGIIKENGKEKYLCYGVPATYSTTPPKSLESGAIFVPLSIFNLHGDGYWLLFQDATTGESVLPS